MAEPKKRGDRWYIAIEVEGVRKAASFGTKTEARAWAAETATAIRAGKGFAVSGRTLGDLFDRFSREECPHRHDSKDPEGAKRIKWEQDRLTFLKQDPLAALALDKLTAEAIDQWQKRQLARVKSSTVRRDRALISAVMTKATTIWKWLPRSPFKDVALPEDVPSRTRTCSADELARLWMAAGQDLGLVQARVVAAFEFACQTGMRGGEIARLMRTYAPEGRAFVHVPRSKNGDARDVALTPRAIEILGQIRALGLDPLFGMVDSQKDALFRKMAKRAAIVGLNFHDSRHTACTMLAKRIPVLELARQLGTRDINTLLVYYNPSAEERAARLQ